MRESSFLDARWLGLYVSQSISRDNLCRRDIERSRSRWKHRTDPDGFVAKYGASRLVHIEHYPTIEEAIAREKALKKWRRAWKIDLIEQNNPAWNDLFDSINA